MKNTLIVIAGPTASGKTKLSIEVAKHFNGQIVSADSMQIYKGMDIGTAKASKVEQAEVPHHMIDIVDPAEDYSASRYVQDASAICDSLLSKNIIPIVVGGTGLYIDSLIAGRNFGAYEDSAVRKSLEEQYNQIGGAKMLKELAVFDSQRAEVLHPADKKRIIRAFEVYMLSGETITAHDIRTKTLPPKYNSLFIIPGYHNRETLYSAINDRVDKMYQLGLFDEVRVLLESGVPEYATSMQAIGYKEVIPALNGYISDDYALDLIKQSSRRYAKRQLTWFSKKTSALRIFHEDYSSFDETINTALSFLEANL